MMLHNIYMIPRIPNDSLLDTYGTYDSRDTI